MKEIESESLRLLRLIVESDGEGRGSAIASAKVYLRILRKIIQPEMGPTGAKLKISVETLREISRLAGEGHGPYKIELLTGVDRGLVRYHLGPSKSMMVAIMRERAP
jgi:hypothetical protein